MQVSVRATCRVDAERAGWPIREVHIDRRQLSYEIDLKFRLSVGCGLLRAPTLRLLEACTRDGMRLKSDSGSKLFVAT